MDQAIQDDWRNQLILAAMVMVGHTLNGETQQIRENPTNITVNDTTTTPITTYHLLHRNSENITTTIDNSTSAMSQKKLFLIPFWQYTWDLWDFHIPLDLNKKKTVMIVHIMRGHQCCTSQSITAFMRQL